MFISDDPLNGATHFALRKKRIARESFGNMRNGLRNNHNPSYGSENYAAKCLVVGVNLNRATGDLLAELADKQAISS